MKSIVPPLHVNIVPRTRWPQEWWDYVYLVHGTIPVQVVPSQPVWFLQLGADGHMLFIRVACG